MSQFNELIQSHVTSSFDARYYKVEASLLDLFHTPIKVSDDTSIMKLISYCLDNSFFRDISCHEANLFVLQDNLTLTIHFCRVLPTTMYLYQTSEETFCMCPKETQQVDQDLIDVLNDLESKPGDTESMKIIRDMIPDDQPLTFGEGWSSISDHLASKKRRTDDGASVSSLSAHSEASDSSDSDSSDSDSSDSDSSDSDTGSLKLHTVSGFSDGGLKVVSSISEFVSDGGLKVVSCRDSDSDSISEFDSDDSHSESDSDDSHSESDSH